MDCNSDSNSALLPDEGYPPWSDPRKRACDEKENDSSLAQAVPPKKRRPSLSLKKRFGKPVDDQELAEAAKGVTPLNTKQCNDWALRNLSSWIASRNEANPSSPVPEDLLSCTDASIVCKWLCCFVQETRKENGEQYPASSLRSLLAAFQRVFLSNKIPFNLFDKGDHRFQDLHKTLDTVCVSLRKEGIGAEVKHAPMISMEHEDIMWQSGVLGCSSPYPLLRAVFYLVGLHFCLRGGQEHRDLKQSQLSRVPSEGYDADTHYVYVENGSKNYQGVRAFAQPTSERCPVHILDLYFSKLPPNATAFYMQPMMNVPVDPTRPWFKKTPVGVNTLKNMMSKISELAGLPVRYTNHSIRATSTSRMFISGVPEKIVAEVSGHKSLTALRQYEKTTKEQFQSAGQCISSMKSFNEMKKEPEEVDKITLQLPSISGSKNCTFNFNFKP